MGLISRDERKRIIERCDGLLKTDPMLRLVARGLLGVPNQTAFSVYTQNQAACPRMSCPDRPT